MGVRGPGGDAFRSIGAGTNGDFNTEYAERTESAEGMEEGMGRDRGARRTARGETDETRMHMQW